MTAAAVPWRPAVSRDLVRKVVQCLTVSVLTTVLSLVTLAVLVDQGVRPWKANVVATALGTVPSYQLNRRWVWRVRRGSDWRRELLPFWTLSFGGLALSTVAVELADRASAALAVSGALRTWTLLAANVGAFGSLWVVQFVLLDRVLFRGRAGGPVRPPAPDPEWSATS